MSNLLLSTDVYKVGHGDQYPKGTTKVYSYLCARKDFGKSDLDEIMFFGVQYYLKKYLSKCFTHDDIDEFISVYENITDISADTINRMRYVAELGYLPLKIKSLMEFKLQRLKMPLLTITNTDPKAYWLVNYIEGLMLKLWYPCTVATKSHQYWLKAMKYASDTCENYDHVPYAVHDFGYRSVSSEESAEIGGAAHLLNFNGSDTILGEYMLKKYYDLSKAKSVPATEHSVMCSSGRNGELDTFNRILDLYPTGIVSLVSDTYDLWNVLSNFTDTLKEKILSRDGKVVFRPDSGNPELIINGNPDGETEEEKKGALQLLWDKFGGTINSMGFKVLNPKVGLIYGDGIYLERYERILSKMKENGFASSNLVIGVGGLLLQNNSRDDFGFAQKTTYIEIDGKPMNVYKDPITDKKKRSHKGLLCVDDNYNVIEECTLEQEERGRLRTVFYNGKIYD